MPGSRNDLFGGHQGLATVLVLLVSFLVSRLVFWFFGVTYDASTIDWFWQYLDVQVLQGRLTAGLFYLHSQPPGFNLFLGLVLKACPVMFAGCFHILYVAMGFVLYCALYRVLRLADFSRVAALICAFCFIISPNSILYENWLFYTYPVAMLLALAALALAKFEKNSRVEFAAIFLCIVVLVCLTRAMFHLVFLVVCSVLVVIPRGVDRRRLALCGSAAIGMVAALYLKNLVMFGFFGASSWTGMNVARIATAAVDRVVIEDMVKAGTVDKIALVPPFMALETYDGALRARAPKCPNAQELSWEWKATGHPNFNNKQYIPVAAAYQRASMVIIRRNFRAYLSSVFDAWLIYSEPAWHYELLQDNVNAIQGYISALSAFRLQGLIDLRPVKTALFGMRGPPTAYHLTGLLFIPCAILVIGIVAVVRIVAALRKGDRLPLAYLFMTFAVVYVAVIGNATELAENNRFRVETDPLIYLLFIMTCRDVVRYAGRRLKDRTITQ